MASAEEARPADEGAAHAEVIAELATELAAEVARRYAIDAESARRIVLELWHKDRSFLEQAAGEPDARRLKRTRAYKRAASAAKAGVYYGLRKYRQDDEQLDAGLCELRELIAAGCSGADPRAAAARDRIVRAHVSSRERSDASAAFFAALFALAPAPESVIDLGCGVQPLMYPFEAAGGSTRRYLALDRDAKVIEVVSAWGTLLGGGKLEARRWMLSEGFDGIAGPAPGTGTGTGTGAGARFDLALALKLVPVLQRQERASLARLRSVPARRLLVSGSRQAMVKRRSIEHREERSLRAFAAGCGLPVLGEFETDSELGLLLGLD